MKDYISIVTAVIAGIFAIISAFLAWRLKQKTDENTQKAITEKEKREEIKSLYIDILTVFENTVGEIGNNKEYTQAYVISEIGAKARLLAPEKVYELFAEAAFLVESWAQLHYRATPKQMKNGNQTITILQSPDPTEKYKLPASEEYEKLQSKLHEIEEVMRKDLKGTLQ